LPHAAFADRCDDFVDAEASAGSEAQVAEVYGLDGWRTGLLLVHGLVD
jgi:hypothetical protein